MERDYIVIQRFNEGHIARRLKDSKYLLVKDGAVSQPFNTVKGLSDTWKKNQIKWSKTHGEQDTATAKRTNTITSKSPATLKASEATEDAADTRGSRSSGADTAAKTGTQLGTAPSEQVETQPAIEEVGTEAPATEAKKPAKKRTAKRKAKK